MPRDPPGVAHVGQIPEVEAVRYRWIAVAVAVIVVASGFGVLATPGVAGSNRLILAAPARSAAPTVPVPSYLEPAYPPALVQNAMVYDAADGYTVMFGGYVGAIGALAPNDTWVFLNNTWYRLTSTVEPPPSPELGMAYDPASREVVLYESLTGGAQTWSYSAGNWKNLSGTSGVAGGREFEPLAIAFDDELGQIVLSGMEPTSGGKGTYDQVLWGLSPGSSWHNLTVVPAQLAVMMGWDPMNDSLMFANCTGSLALRSGAWSIHANPPFGGPCLSNGGVPFGEMITWDPSIPGFLVISLAYAFEYSQSWTMLPEVLPLPGSGGALTYDGYSAAAVEFGGFLVDNRAGTVHVSDTTWLFAHGNWTALPIPSSPPPSLPWTVIVVLVVVAAIVLVAVAVLRRRRHSVLPGGNVPPTHPPAR